MQMIRETSFDQTIRALEMRGGAGCQEKVQKLFLVQLQPPTVGVFHLFVKRHNFYKKSSLIHKSKVLQIKFTLLHI